ncbi:hypothetical protein QLQ15_04560 [Lysobacter sp. LF1]|uniref:EscT/YscT/HrcT family type III secretion system export apparatus protein n=1 Tax=Lysobacter stagni TaxID=3045172 RepID=A0ABT6XDG0_9GAMM|nr:hypothetical protein [Lysobacter sp. LF1]MDI9238180.1 hypothetical protein [Lysobacter sp. LF1]
MTTHATGPFSGLSWLKRAINLGRTNARAVFGAASIMMAAALLPSIVQLIVLSILKPGPSGSMVVAALATVLSLLILSPLIGGYLRLIDATEHGRPANAIDVFAPFREGGDAGRLIRFGVLMTLTYVVIALVLLSLFGEGMGEWYTQMAQLQTQAAGGQVDPSQIPEVPEGFGRLLGVGSVVFLILSGVYAIGFGQVALGQRSTGEAMADGFVGTFKNLLPLLLLAVVAVLAMIPVGLLLALVLGVVSAVGSLLHPTLGLALMLPLYLAFMVALYVVLFGIMYFMWRDVCGEPPAPRADEVAL